MMDLGKLKKTPDVKKLEELGDKFYEDLKLEDISVDEATRILGYCQAKLNGDIGNMLKMRQIKDI